MVAVVAVSGVQVTSLLKKVLEMVPLSTSGWYSGESRRLTVTPVTPWKSAYRFRPRQPTLKPKPNWNSGVEEPNIFTTSWLSMTPSAFWSRYLRSPGRTSPKVWVGLLLIST